MDAVAADIDAGVVPAERSCAAAPSDHSAAFASASASAFASASASAGTAQPIASSPDPVEPEDGSRFRRSVKDMIRFFSGGFGTSKSPSPTTTPSPKILRKSAFSSRSASCPPSQQPEKLGQPPSHQQQPWSFLQQQKWRKKQQQEVAAEIVDVVSSSQRPAAIGIQDENIEETGGIWIGYEKDEFVRDDGLEWVDRNDPFQQGFVRSVSPEGLATVEEQEEMWARSEARVHGRIEVSEMSSSHGDGMFLTRSEAIDQDYGFDGFGQAALPAFDRDYGVSWNDDKNLTTTGINPPNYPDNRNDCSNQVFTKSVSPAFDRSSQAAADAVAACAAAVAAAEDSEDLSDRHPILFRRAQSLDQRVLADMAGQRIQPIEEERKRPKSDVIDISDNLVESKMSCEVRSVTDQELMDYYAKIHDQCVHSEYPNADPQVLSHSPMNLNNCLIDTMPSALKQSSSSTHRSSLRMEVNVEKSAQILNESSLKTETSTKQTVTSKLLGEASSRTLPPALSPKSKAATTSSVLLAESSVSTSASTVSSRTLPPALSPKSKSCTSAPASEIKLVSSSSSKLPPALSPKPKTLTKSVTSSSVSHSSNISSSPTNELIKTKSAVQIDSDPKFKIGISDELKTVTDSIEKTNDFKQIDKLIDNKKDDKILPKPEIKSDNSDVDLSFKIEMSDSGGNLHSKKPKSKEKERKRMEKRVVQFAEEKNKTNSNIHPEEVLVDKMISDNNEKKIPKISGKESTSDSDKAETNKTTKETSKIKGEESKEKDISKREPTESHRKEAKKSSAPENELEKNEKSRKEKRTSPKSEENVQMKRHNSTERKKKERSQFIEKSAVTKKEIGKISAEKYESYMQENKIDDTKKKHVSKTNEGKKGIIKSWYDQTIGHITDDSKNDDSLLGKNEQLDKMFHMKNTTDHHENAIVNKTPEIIKGILKNGTGKRDSFKIGESSILNLNEGNKAIEVSQKDDLKTVTPSNGSDHNIIVKKHRDKSPSDKHKKRIPEINIGDIGKKSNLVEKEKSKKISKTVEKQETDVKNIDKSGNLEKESKEKSLKHKNVLDKNTNNEASNVISSKEKEHVGEKIKSSSKEIKRTGSKHGTDKGLPHHLESGKKDKTVIGDTESQEGKRSEISSEINFDLAQSNNLHSKKKSSRDKKAEKVSSNGQSKHEVTTLKDKEIKLIVKTDENSIVKNETKKREAEGRKQKNELSIDSIKSKTKKRENIKDDDKSSNSLSIKIKQQRSDVDSRQNIIQGSDQVIEKEDFLPDFGIDVDESQHLHSKKPSSKANKNLNSDTNSSSTNMELKKNSIKQPDNPKYILDTYENINAENEKKNNDSLTVKNFLTTNSSRKIDKNASLDLEISKKDNSMKEVQPSFYAIEPSLKLDLKDKKQVDKAVTASPKPKKSIEKNVPIKIDTNSLESIKNNDQCLTGESKNKKMIKSEHELFIKTVPDNLQGSITKTNNEKIEFNKNFIHQLEFGTQISPDSEKIEEYSSLEIPVDMDQSENLHSKKISKKAKNKADDNTNIDIPTIENKSNRLDIDESKEKNHEIHKIKETNSQKDLENSMEIKGNDSENFTVKTSLKIPLAIESDTTCDLNAKELLLNEKMTETNSISSDKLRIDTNSFIKLDTITNNLDSPLPIQSNLIADRNTKELILDSIISESDSYSEIVFNKPQFDISSYVKSPINLDLNSDLNSSILENTSIIPQDTSIIKDDKNLTEDSVPTDSLMISTLKTYKCGDINSAADLGDVLENDLKSMSDLNTDKPRFDLQSFIKSDSMTSNLEIPLTSKLNFIPDTIENDRYLDPINIESDLKSNYIPEKTHFDINSYLKSSVNTELHSEIESSTNDIINVAPSVVSVDNSINNDINKIKEIQNRDNTDLLVNHEAIHIQKEVDEQEKFMMTPNKVNAQVSGYYVENLEGNYNGFIEVKSDSSENVFSKKTFQTGKADNDSSIMSNLTQDIPEEKLRFDLNSYINTNSLMTNLEMPMEKLENVNYERNKENLVIDSLNFETELESETAKTVEKPHFDVSSYIQSSMNMDLDSNLNSSAPAIDGSVGENATIDRYNLISDTMNFSKDHITIDNPKIILQNQENIFTLDDNVTDQNLQIMDVSKNVDDINLNITQGKTINDLFINSNDKKPYVSSNKPRFDVNSYIQSNALVENFELSSTDVSNNNSELNKKDNLHIDSLNFEGEFGQETFVSQDKPRFNIDSYIKSTMRLDQISDKTNVLQDISSDKPRFDVNSYIQSNALVENLELSSADESNINSELNKKDNLHIDSLNFEGEFGQETFVSQDKPRFNIDSYIKSTISLDKISDKTNVLQDISSDKPRFDVNSYLQSNALVENLELSSADKSNNNSELNEKENLHIDSLNFEGEFGQETFVSQDKPRFNIDSYIKSTMSLDQISDKTDVMPDISSDELRFDVDSNMQSNALVEKSELSSADESNINFKLNKKENFHFDSQNYDKENFVGHDKPHFDIDSKKNSTISLNTNLNIDSNVKKSGSISALSPIMISKDVESKKYSILLSQDILKEDRQNAKFIETELENIKIAEIDLKDKLKNENKNGEYINGINFNTEKSKSTMEGSDILTIDKFLLYNKNSEDEKTDKMGEEKSYVENKAKIVNTKILKSDNKAFKTENETITEDTIGSICSIEKHNDENEIQILNIKKFGQDVEKPNDHSMNLTTHHFETIECNSGDKNVQNTTESDSSIKLDLINAQIERDKTFRQILERVEKLERSRSLRESRKPISIIPKQRSIELEEMNLAKVKKLQQESKTFSSNSSNSNSFSNNKTQESNKNLIAFGPKEADIGISNEIGNENKDMKVLTKQTNLEKTKTQEIGEPVVKNSIVTLSYIENQSNVSTELLQTNFGISSDLKIDDKNQKEDKAIPNVDEIETKFVISPKNFENSTEVDIGSENNSKMNPLQSITKDSSLIATDITNLKESSSDLTKINSEVISLIKSDTKNQEEAKADTLESNVENSSISNKNQNKQAITLSQSTLDKTSDVSVVRVNIGEQKLPKKEGLKIKSEFFSTERLDSKNDSIILEPKLELKDQKETKADTLERNIEIRSIDNKNQNEQSMKILQSNLDKTSDISVLRVNIEEQKLQKKEGLQINSEFHSTKTFDSKNDSVIPEHKVDKPRFDIKSFIKADDLQKNLALPSGLDSQQIFDINVNDLDNIKLDSKLTSDKPRFDINSYINSSMNSDLDIDINSNTMADNISGFKPAQVLDLNKSFKSDVALSTNEISSKDKITVEVDNQNNKNNKDVDKENKYFQKSIDQIYIPKYMEKDEINMTKSLQENIAEEQCETALRPSEKNQNAKIEESNVVVSSSYNVSTVSQQSPPQAIATKSSSLVPLMIYSPEDSKPHHSAVIELYSPDANSTLPPQVIDIHSPTTLIVHSPTTMTVHSPKTLNALPPTTMDVKSIEMHKIMPNYDGQELQRHEQQMVQQNLEGKHFIPSVAQHNSLTMMNSREYQTMNKNIFPNYYSSQNEFYSTSPFSRTMAPGHDWHGYLDEGYDLVVHDEFDDIPSGNTEEGMRRHDPGYIDSTYETMLMEEMQREEFTDYNLEEMRGSSMERDCGMGEILKRTGIQQPGISTLRNLETAVLNDTPLPKYSEQVSHSNLIDSVGSLVDQKREVQVEEIEIRERKDDPDESTDMVPEIETFIKETMKPPTRRQSHQDFLLGSIHQQILLKHQLQKEEEKVQQKEQETNQKVSPIKTPPSKKIAEDLEGLPPVKQLEQKQLLQRRQQLDEQLQELQQQRQHDQQRRLRQQQQIAQRQHSHESIPTDPSLAAARKRQKMRDNSDFYGQNLQYYPNYRIQDYKPRQHQKQWKQHPREHLRMYQSPSQIKHTASAFKRPERHKVSEEQQRHQEQLQLNLQQQTSETLESKLDKDADMERPMSENNQEIKEQSEEQKELQKQSLSCDEQVKLQQNSDDTAEPQQLQQQSEKSEEQELLEDLKSQSIELEELRLLQELQRPSDVQKPRLSPSKNLEEEEMMQLQSEELQLLEGDSPQTIADVWKNFRTSSGYCVAGERKTQNSDHSDKESNLQMALVPSAGTGVGAHERYMAAEDRMRRRMEEKAEKRKKQQAAILDEISAAVTSRPGSRSASRSGSRSSSPTNFPPAGTHSYGRSFSEAAPGSSRSGSIGSDAGTYYGALVPVQSAGGASPKASSYGSRFTGRRAPSTGGLRGSQGSLLDASPSAASPPSASMSIKDFRSKPFAAVRSVRSSISRDQSEDELSEVGSVDNFLGGPSSRRMSNVSVDDDAFYAAAVSSTQQQQQQQQQRMPAGPESDAQVDDFALQIQSIRQQFGRQVSIGEGGGSVEGDVGVIGGVSGGVIDDAGAPLYVTEPTDLRIGDETAPSSSS